MGRAGFDRIDRDGKPCGGMVGWPLNPDIIPPKIGERVVRPSVESCLAEFNLTVRALHLEGPARANARAHMRRFIIISPAARLSGST
jgi:hypothetical protein